LEKGKKRAKRSAGRKGEGKKKVMVARQGAPRSSFNTKT